MKLYLAGFDVFRPDAKNYGKKLKNICAAHGVTGLYPLDNEADSADDIFKGNLALIDECDALLANLNDFRGRDVDSGTAFEVGYAFARGKQIFGYLSDDRPLREKLGEKDAEGFSVENFQLPVNLMIACCTKIVQGGFTDGLKVCLLSYHR